MQPPVRYAKKGYNHFYLSFPIVVVVVETTSNPKEAQEDLTTLEILQSPQKTSSKNMHQKIP
jgi:hypothetical protein